ncbi:MAG: 4Fe-4S binding protein [Mogibacterium sp.]|nr:4Fe-4S binding protein [Mogibacterium sp.]
MISKDQFLELCKELFYDSTDRIVDIPGIGPTELYEEPLIGFASADDEIFDAYLRQEAIGSMFRKPAEWLPEAKTVVAFFFPFTEQVRVTNSRLAEEPSVEWLYARIEGQAFLNGMMRAIRDRLLEDGITSCIPAQDPRFGLEKVRDESGEDFHTNCAWSERHAAYACGLGTFGLSRGLITKKGVAGRFASIILSERYELNQRDYTGIYDYCIRCGVCAVNCPVGAISLDYGKNNLICNIYVDKMLARYSPRYGCGKCQVGVPCETCRP